MRPARRTILALICCIHVCLPAVPVPSRASVGAPDPVRILQAAGRACDLTNRYTYDYTYEGSGGLRGTYHGSVRLLEGSGPVPSRLYVDTFVGGQSGQSGEREVITFTDSRSTRVLDMTAKTLTVGTTAGGGSHLMYYIYPAVLFQLIQPGAFQFEAEKGQPVYEGEATVGGVDCHVIRITHPFGAQVWWYIGKDDYFPRAQTWVDTRPGQEGEFELRIADLDFDAPLTDADFVVDAPEGFTVIDDDARVVTLGQPAPEWAARTRSGEALSGTSLAGSVVVLEFWATWCPPCRQLMPAIARLADELDGRAVRFVGVNTWEASREKAEAFIEREGLSYPQVLDGEALARIFKVYTLPALVVIAADGTVTRYEVGGEGTTETALRGAIDEALAR